MKLTEEQIKKAAAKTAAKVAAEFGSDEISNLRCQIAILAVWLKFAVNESAQRLLYDHLNDILCDIPCDHRQGVA